MKFLSSRFLYTHESLVIFRMSEINSQFLAVKEKARKAAHELARVETALAQQRQNPDVLARIEKLKTKYGQESAEVVFHLLVLDILRNEQKEQIVEEIE